MATMLILPLMFLAICGVHAVKDEYYTVAVYEHARFGTHSDPAAKVVQTNLNMYERVTAAAREKGADMIVFPEYGIILPGTRQELKAYLEYVPDPSRTFVVPCFSSAYGTTILRALSCMAMENSMYVVANIGDIQSCSGDKDCPADGSFHFNTNVVFDREGTLIHRYHKEHLFFEDGMDLPKGVQNSTFVTDFGTFATYICFDIIFQRMSDVAQWPSVDGFAFPTMWINSPPQFPSVQYFQAWAMGNNANLFASNIQLPAEYAVGSGIFHGRSGASAYTYNPDGLSKLIVAKVPKTTSRFRLGQDVGIETEMFDSGSIIAIEGNNTWSIENDGQDIINECSTKLVNNADIRAERCIDENTMNYTFVKLEGLSGRGQVCSNGMCCSVAYITDNIEENFYLGVFNGTSADFISDRYQFCEEDCIVARCDAIGDNPCATFPRTTKTTFHQLELTANFSNQFVYPSVVESGFKLLNTTDWTYNVKQLENSDDKYRPHEASITFKSLSGRRLITVGFKGRCYQRDPPYVR